MRRTSASGLAMMVIAAFTCSAVPAKASPKKFDGYIIKLKDAGIESINDLESAGIKVDHRIPQLSMVYTKSLPSKISARAQKRIEYIERNYFRTLVTEPLRSGETSETSKEANRLWGMKTINAPEAWGIHLGSKDVTVAVSDTGIWSHLDLAENRWKNPGEIPKNKIDDDGNGFVDDVDGWSFETNSHYPSDDHYHGTHVAGTIGAVHNGIGVAGVAAHVRLMSAKFIGRSGSGTDVGAVGTILYAADNGARILNASWGGDEYSQAIYDAIEYAKHKGMLVVCAAGNDSRNADKHPMYPAASDNENIISVAAGSSYKKNPMAGFSNWGLESVDLVAPGDGIMSTFNPTYSPIYREYYMSLSGTSMAAPHVSGAAALIMAINPSLDWRQVKDILLSTVAPHPKFQGKVKTGGWLDVHAAAKMAAGIR